MKELSKRIKLCLENQLVIRFLWFIVIREPYNMGNFVISYCYGYCLRLLTNLSFFSLEAIISFSLFLLVSLVTAPICFLEYSIYGFGGIKWHIFYKNKRGNCSVTNLRFLNKYIVEPLTQNWRISNTFSTTEKMTSHLIHWIILIKLSMNVPCGYTKRNKRGNLSRSADYFFSNFFLGNTVFKKISGY